MVQYNFQMSLDKQFKNKLEEMHDKYGTDMMEIEGMAPGQLDTCDFFKNFMETKTIADATIDDNANVTNRNINTMVNESQKSHLKLLSRNKIYIEMREEFGKEVADQFLESAINGEIYEHDSHDSSYKPYSYFGDETILIKYKEETRLISFKELYNTVDEPVVTIHEKDGALGKYTSDLLVWDNDMWTKIIRVIKKPRTTDFKFIKGSNGVSQIVTDNHPVITTQGDVEARNVTKRHKIISKRPVVEFGEKESVYVMEGLKNIEGVMLNGRNVDSSTNVRSCGQVSISHIQNSMLNKIDLDFDFGWFYGMLLAEGNLISNGLQITQNDGVILNKLEEILIKKQYPYTIKRDEDSNKVIIRSKLLMYTMTNIFDYNNKSRDKKMPSNFMSFNKDFLKGVIGGLIDGDGTLMNKTNRRITLRITSRELLNQVSFIVQQMGYNVRDGKPLLAKDNGNSFKQVNHVYQIAFTPYKDGETFSSIKINDNVDSYNNQKDGEKHCNSKYSFGYGEVNVINNDSLDLQNEDFVYDISTETGTFMCNNIVSHNCFAFSLKDIVNKGLFFIDEMKANPAKHWDTFNHHVLEFLSYATNMQSGAVGLPDYLIYAYYYFQADTRFMNEIERDRYRNQKFQEFVFNLNQPYLKGGIQSAYTNISILDYDHLLKFFGSEKFPDGSNIMDHIDGIRDFQQEFLNYVGELRKVKWHTFPVISSSLIFKDGEYKDERTAKMVVEHNWKYGFNDVNMMNVDEATSLASCCRLVSNKAELNKHKVFNSIGGSDVNIGSTKVVTINLVRLALLSDGISDFLQRVEKTTKLIHQYHYAHRKILQKLVDKDLLPLYTHELMKFEDQFATVGINGVYEATRVLGGISNDEQGAYYNEDGLNITEDMFKLVGDLNEGTIDKYGYMSNVEQVPAESTAVKLNKKDRLFFGNRFINERLGEDCYIYGNQWIPLKEETSIFHRIDSAKLDEHCGGGAILHINLGENFNTFEDAWEFTQGLAKKGVKYFSYISLIDICDNDHSFFGKTCPICGEPSTSKGIKIVGYLVKQDSYKKERKQELSERKFYNKIDSK